MKNLLNLVRLSWKVKSNIQNCMSFNENSEEFHYGKYYENLLNNLDDKTTTKEKINDLITELKGFQSKLSGRKELENLFLSVNEFLNNFISMKD